MQGGNPHTARQSEGQSLAPPVEGVEVAGSQTRDGRQQLGSSKTVGGIPHKAEGGTRCLRWGLESQSKDPAPARGRRSEAKALPLTSPGTQPYEGVSCQQPDTSQQRRGNPPTASPSWAQSPSSTPGPNMGLPLSGTPGFGSHSCISGSQTYS
jgi:hypothetical protein